MHAYPTKSSRFESTDIASVMVDDIGCSRRHQYPRCVNGPDILRVETGLANEKGHGMCNVYHCSRSRSWGIKHGPVVKPITTTGFEKSGTPIFGHGLQKNAIMYLAILPLVSHQSWYLIVVKDGQVFALVIIKIVFGRIHTRSLS